MKNQHDRYARIRERDDLHDLQRPKATHTSRITIRLPEDLRLLAEKLNLNMSEICRQALEKAVEKAKK
jgi:post-segregation antitoxin (ccd killing protein)